MTEFHFADATGYSLDQLTEMHNASFEGYFFPLTMTPQLNADLWRRHQIDATRCVVMHDAAGAFVGTARMGTRGVRGWCGGFGIVPAFRGAGAGQLLAAEMVRVARGSELEQLQLEVLTQNVRALRLYERVGFSIRRRLVGLELDTDALSAAAPIQAETVAVETLLLYPRQTPPPCWSRESPSLLTMRAQAIVVRSQDGDVNGLVMQRAGNKARIQAVVISDTLSNAEVAGLLRRAAGDATQYRSTTSQRTAHFWSAAARSAFASTSVSTRWCSRCDRGDAPPLRRQRCREARAHHESRWAHASNTPLSPPQRRGVGGEDPPTPGTRGWPRSARPG